MVHFGRAHERGVGGGVRRGRDGDARGSIMAELCSTALAVPTLTYDSHSVGRESVANLLDEWDFIVEAELEDAGLLAIGCPTQAALHVLDRDFTLMSVVHRVEERIDGRNIRSDARKG